MKTNTFSTVKKPIPSEFHSLVLHLIHIVIHLMSQLCWTALHYCGKRATSKREGKAVLGSQCQRHQHMVTHVRDTRLCTQTAQRDREE